LLLLLLTCFPVLLRRYVLHTATLLLLLLLLFGTFQVKISILTEALNQEEWLWGHSVHHLPDRKRHLSCLHPVSSSKSPHLTAWGKLHNSISSITKVLLLSAA